MNDRETNRANHLPSEAERLLAEQLEEGAADESTPAAEALRRLSPRWEVRVVSERDPVTEETLAYRRMAKEIDNRYDRFVPRDSDG